MTSSAVTFSSFWYQKELGAEGERARDSGVLGQVALTFTEKPTGQWIVLASLKNGRGSEKLETAGHLSLLRGPSW